MKEINIQQQLRLCNTFEQLFDVLLENERSTEFFQTCSCNGEEVFRRIKRYLDGEGHIESVPKVFGIREHVMRIHALNRRKCTMPCQCEPEVRHFVSCCVQKAEER